MPAKKKTPTLRWKLQPKKWYKPFGTYQLQEWSDTKNKYVEVPLVD